MYIVCIITTIIRTIMAVIITFNIIFSDLKGLGKEEKDYIHIKKAPRLASNSHTHKSLQESYEASRICIILFIVVLKGEIQPFINTQMLSCVWQ